MLCIHAPACFCLKTGHVSGTLCTFVLLHLWNKCDPCAGESESDEDDVLAMNSPDRQAGTSQSDASAGPDDTITAGSTSTAQPFTDAVAPYDDIDTDDVTYSRSSDTEACDRQREISQTSVASTDHLPDAQRSSAPHTDKHTFPQPASRFDSDHSGVLQASPSKNTALATDQSLAVRLASSNAAPEASGQHVAGSLAFQQELQRRSWQQQARTAAVGDDNTTDAASQRHDRGLR